MHRFYCPDLATLSSGTDAPVALDHQQTHHAMRVLRLQMGDPVTVFDGQGAVGRGVLEQVGDGVAVRLAGVRNAPPLTPMIDVAGAVPKGPRAGEMVNQLSQAGADAYIPLLTRRSVVEPSQSQLARFTRVAVESGKQCLRLHLMRVGQPSPLDSVLAQPHDLRLITAPAKPDGTQLAGAALSQRLVAAKRVLILVGPEGGWADDEFELAKQHGCEPWTLGPHVLRIETAAVAAVTIARYLTLSSDAGADASMVAV